MLNYRDFTTIFPVLKDVAGANSVGAINNKTITGPGTFITEAFLVGRYTELIAFLYITAHAGSSPTLDIKFQISHDGIHWVDAADAFTQVTTTDGVFLKRLTANFGNFMRALIVMGGTATPSYTATLAIQAKG